MECEQVLFECTQCGDCCKGFGGTYLTDPEIDRVAAHIGVSAAEFRQRYCVRSGNRLLLTQQNNGYCIFFDGNCSIHAVKPQMCRKWPFIQSLLVDIANWRIMADVCPGMNNSLDDRHLMAAIRREMNK